MPQLNNLLAQLPLDETLRALVVTAPLIPLDSGSVDAKAAGVLSRWLSSSSGISEASLSGLWLLVGDLDRSHQLSQEIHSAEGSFWHGIMHRREGDYSNAKYWMRHVGAHAVVDQLQRHEPSYRDPYAFIDQVEHAIRTKSPNAEQVAKLERIQWLEWQLLFQHSWHDGAQSRLSLREL